MQFKEKTWERRRWNKVIKEKIMVIIKKEKNNEAVENQRKNKN